MYHVNSQKKKTVAISTQLIVLLVAARIKVGRK